MGGDNNTIYENNECGIYFGGTNNLVFHNNANIIRLTGALNSEVYENSIAEVRVDQSSNNTVHDNNISGKGTGVDIEGYCTNNTIQNNNITTVGSVGVAVDGGIGIKIIDNNIQAINSTGISVSHYGYEIVVTGNSIANCEQGISFRWGASNHVISGNTIARNKYGVFIVGETNITITENLITSNVYGVYSESIFGGNQWYYATENNITLNIISENIGSAIFFNASSQQNKVTKNIITGNNFAVLIGDDSSRNNFYQNNFVDNNASVGGFSWREHWNTTYPVGGNYWSDYSGTDNNGDGIGDTEYIVDEINKDYYPLMTPFDVPTITVPFILPEYTSSTPEEPEQPDSTSQQYSRVYIWSDGLIEPSVAPISRNGNFYALTSDLNAELLVEKSNIIIDAKNFTVTGKSRQEGIGIYLKDVTNVTIKNFNISNFKNAIHLDNSSFVVVCGNNLMAQANGIVLDSHCNNNTISGNTLNSTWYNALFLSDCSGNIIRNNTVVTTATVIEAYNSSENQVYDNCVISSSGHLGIGFREFSNNNLFYSNEGSCGIWVEGKNNKIFENNITWITLQGADLTYQYDATNNTVFRNTVNGISMRHASYNELYNNTVHIGYNGIYFQYSSSFNVIRDNYFIGEGTAIFIENSGKNNTIKANTITTYEHPAIKIDDASRTKIVDNKIQAINSTGVLIFDHATAVTISGNAIGNCEQAIYIKGPSSENMIFGNTLTRNSHGIYLFGSFHNLIEGNSIRDNTYGIYTESVYTRGDFWYYSQNNNISCNIISENSAAGIFLNTTSKQSFVINNHITNNNIGVKIDENSSPNTFYSNNFVDNNVSVSSFPWRENWNSTYSIGGNYWSDYAGTDNNGDGIGDTEHVIDENNNDYYPLTAPVAVPALDVPSALPDFVPTEPEEPETPTEPEEPEEPEIPTEPEQPSKPETPTQPGTPEMSEPEQPTTKEPAISTEVLVIVAVAAICVIGVAAYWTHQQRK
ncbi:MAG: hypothetical protein CW691_06000 [Candidatus Bathyarchaeum sp.]|nr:MAG: hypothetical protein CW691_06000 [Candidatus Bathyarchaeum sp.]